MSRPWNPSSQRELPPHRHPPFQTPSPSAVESSQDGAPFSAPAPPQTHKLGPDTAVPYHPEAPRKAGRDALCASLESFVPARAAASPPSPFPNAPAIPCRKPPGRRTFFDRLRCHRPINSDPTQRFPTIPKRRAELFFRPAALIPSFSLIHGLTASLRVSGPVFSSAALPHIALISPLQTGAKKVSSFQVSTL